MSSFRSLLLLAIYALTYCCVVENKMAPSALSVRSLANVRAAVSDFIISSFVKDMRATIDEMVNAKGPSFNQSGPIGYLSVQMPTKETGELKQRKKEWRGKIKSILSRKERKLSRSEQFLKKLTPTANAIKKKDSNPLIIFINKKSGGKTGSMLLERLKPNFPTAQVCDLSKNSAADYLKLFSDCSDLRILICGGDGTVGWIMDETKKSLPTHNHTFGIVPLGTGNDLCIQLKDIPTLKNIPRNSDIQRLDENFSMQSKGEEIKGIPCSLDTINNAELQSKTYMELVPNEKVVTNLVPSMVISDPALLKKWYKSPKIVQLDRWAVKVQRVHGRKRRLLKLLLIQNKVKGRSNSIVSGISGFLSNLWGFGSRQKNRNSSASNPAEESITTDERISTSEELGNAPAVKKMKKKRNEGVKKKEIMDFTMNNYLGIGVDGAVTLGFHSLRQKVPALFFSRWVNKLWYGMIGIRTLLLGWSRDLSLCCQLICDGEVVKIPPGTQSLIILNINSYAGGMKMWPDASSLDQNDHNGTNGNSDKNERKSSFSASDFSDGRVEIVAVSGIKHLGAIKAGIGRATPIAQGLHVTLTSTASLPIQLDGEPWRQKPCKIEISLSERVNIMLPTVDKT